MDLFHILSLVFGGAAILASVASYQCKTRRMIMAVLMITGALWCLHFGFMGEWTPVGLNLINVIRALVYAQRGEKTWADKAFIPFLFAGANVAATLLTWKGAFSLVPLAASFFATFGYWQKEERRLRLCGVGVCAGWLIYNIHVRSYPGIINETVTLFSIFLALLRFRKTKAQSKKGEQNDGDH